MQLPPEQTARFYRIWLALLHYVNEQLHLVPAFPASEERNALLPLSDELHLRNALWADDGLRERFISANPAGLSSADLTVVASWRYRRAGSFYIVRALKKYTVFLSEDAPPRAYGVLSLSTPIEEPSVRKEGNCRTVSRSPLEKLSKAEPTGYGYSLTSVGPLSRAPREALSKAPPP